jgi:catechol 2,3-dioxygenase-like lactoylglutathione lyase family enzyme
MAGRCRRRSSPRTQRAGPHVTDRSPEARPPEYGILPPRYRLPETTRVGRVRLQVGDLGRSRDWYTRILGFRALEGEGARVVLKGRSSRKARRRAGPAPDAGALTSPSFCPTERRIWRARAPADPRGTSRIPRPGLYHFDTILVCPTARRPGQGWTVRGAPRPGGGVLGLGLAGLGASDHRVSEALYGSWTGSRRHWGSRSGTDSHQVGHVGSEWYRRRDSTRRPAAAAFRRSGASRPSLFGGRGGAPPFSIVGRTRVRSRIEERAKRSVEKRTE